MRKLTRKQIARLGGLASSGVTSPEKANASRENGKKGGRPANPEIRKIMEEKHVSRQRAWQIYHNR